VAVGIVFAAGMVVVTAAQALMWPVYAEFHACLDRALTHRAQDACFAELEQRTQDLLLDLMPWRGTGACTAPAGSPRPARAANDRGGGRPRSGAARARRAGSPGSPPPPPRGGAAEAKRR